MKIYHLSAMALAAAVGCAVGCGSSSGCGGSNVNSSSNVPAVTCGAGTINNNGVCQSGTTNPVKTN